MRQQLADGNMRICGPGGEDERGIADGRTRFGIGAVLEEQTDFWGVGSSAHERTGSLSICRVDLGSTFQKQTDASDVTVARGVKQRRVARIVARIGRGALIKRSFEFVDVATAKNLKKLARHARFWIFGDDQIRAEKRRTKEAREKRSYLHKF